MNELSPAQRRELRANAHHLRPVVSIAGNGLTPAVVTEIERSLQAHELIKIKVHGIERKERDDLMIEVCKLVGAEPVQHIGTVLVVWRKRRETDETSTESSHKLKGDARPSKAKSARVFAANARRTALIREAAERQRKTSRYSRPGGKART